MLWEGKVSEKFRLRAICDSRILSDFISVFKLYWKVFEVWGYSSLIAEIGSHNGYNEGL